MQLLFAAGIQELLDVTTRFVGSVQSCDDDDPAQHMSFEMSNIEQETLKNGNGLA